MKKIAKKADIAWLKGVDHFGQLVKICHNGRLWYRASVFPEMGNFSQVDIGNQEHILFLPKNDTTGM